ncbi:MAG: hypothetical protein PARBB_00956 [Parabacteroides distasonis]
MNTVRFFLFILCVSFVSNVSSYSANIGMGEIKAELNGSIDIQSDSETMRFSITGVYDPGGHYEAVFTVPTAGQPNYTYKWNISGGDRSYVWPTGDGSRADVSIYYSSTGRAYITCEVYNNGSLVTTVEEYVYF